MPTKHSPLLVILNIIGFVGVLVTNYLANALPIAGRTPKDVSDLLPTLFTPAGFTFAIWGVIYLLLAGFVIYQARFMNKKAPEGVERVGWLFLATCVFNVSWLFAWHHVYIGLALLIIVAFLVTLIIIYQRLHQRITMELLPEKWFVHLPFSVYLAWLSVATIANASIFLVYMRWDGQPFGPQFWTVLMLAAAAVIGLLALFKRNDYAFAAVIIWALYGIFNNRVANFNTEDRLVEMAAIVMIAVLVLGILFKVVRKQVRG